MIDGPMKRPRCRATPPLPAAPGAPAVLPPQSLAQGLAATPNRLPSITRPLQGPGVTALVAQHGHTWVVGQAKARVDALRSRALTGAQAATGVNNNAAAVVNINAAAAVVNNAAAVRLTVAAPVAARPGRKQVIVSRGELVEVGGAFRLPDVMAAAGATLVEVGTTNRTHPHDDERAITSRTAGLMKIHTSNCAVQGWPAAVDESALVAAVAPRFAVSLVDLMGQVGSGSLPVARLPSVGLALSLLKKQRNGRALGALAGALRSLPLPVIGRIADDALRLDLRCLEDPAPFVNQPGRLQQALE